MDLGTVIGLLLGWVSLIGGFLMEGGRLGALLEPSAAVIVVGGSLGATLISFSIKKSQTMFVVLRHAFQTKQMDQLGMVNLIVDLAKRARQSGILVLESEARNIQNSFIRNGIQMVVDGTQPELVREILETELDAMRTRHQFGEEFLSTWGGYAPTLGIIGTVTGLVHMLESLSSPDKMGPAVATAFIATLYGIAVANLFLLPVAAKLKARSHEEVNTYEMAIEGILSLQAGENPRVVATKMRSFLSPQAKKALEMENL